jgi:hypothetical protein
LGHECADPYSLWWRATNLDVGREEAQIELYSVLEDLYIEEYQRLFGDEEKEN